MREFYYWRVLLKQTSDSLRQKRDNTKGLLHSILPEARAHKLIDEEDKGKMKEPPEKWHENNDGLVHSLLLRVLLRALLCIARAARLLRGRAWYVLLLLFTARGARLLRVAGAVGWCSSVYA
eukprot:614693-Rhodomonas_salina.2